jgi:hypothetical protein
MIPQEYSNSHTTDLLPFLSPVDISFRPSTSVSGVTGQQKEADAKRGRPPYSNRKEVNKYRC